MPFPAGGATDQVARNLADVLGARWGQSIVVENRGGASTIIGSTAVAQARPDGYTLGIATNNFVINPAVGMSLPYDTLSDFTPLSLVSMSPEVLTVHPSFPAQTLVELISRVKESGDPVNFTSVGPRSIAHMTGELFQHVAGIKMTHVPYSGSAPALIDVLAGRVPIMFDAWNALRPHVDAGRLRLLAVGSEARLPTMPDVPTFGELFPGFLSIGFQGVIAPGGLPAALRDRIAADIDAVVRSARYGEKLREAGADPVSSRPDEFAAFVRSEIVKWREVARTAGIRAE